MKFSIVHPSRERIGRCGQAILHWIDNFSNHNQLEYILSIDTDDEQIEGYKELANDYGIQLIINNNRSLVDASNNGAKLATGDCIVLVSDDFGCPKDWDLLLQSEIEKSQKEMYGVLIDDGISAKEGTIMALPILSMTMYKRLGYIYHPSFFSLWADNALIDVVRILDGLIDARHLLFEHYHYSVGKSKKDSTYARENSLRAHSSGVHVYNLLKSRNYDL